MHVLVSHLQKPISVFCPNLFVHFWGIQLFKESKIVHFIGFNFPKLPFNNLKLHKSEKVDMSHQFNSEGAKGKVNTLIYDFSKWMNILGHQEKRENGQIYWDRGCVIQVDESKS